MRQTRAFSIVLVVARRVELNVGVYDDDRMVAGEPPPSANHLWGTWARVFLKTTSERHPIASDASTRGANGTRSELFASDCFN